MGRFNNGIHYSWTSELGPNERFGVEDDMSFQELALKLEADKKQNIAIDSASSYEISETLSEQKESDTYTEQITSENAVVLKKQKYKNNSLRDLMQKFPEHIILIKAGAFYMTYYESAIAINQVFGYKLFNQKFSKFSRLGTGFPLNKLDYVVEHLNELNLNYVVVDNYVISKINSDGENILSNNRDNLLNIPSVSPDTQNNVYKVVDIKSGVVGAIDSNSIFGYYFIGKNIGDIVKFLSPDYEVIELKIKDIF